MKNTRAKTGQHRRPEKRHHSAHQKGQKGDDGRGVEAGLFNVSDHRREAPALGPKQSASDGFQDQANEPQQLQRVPPDCVDRTTNAGQQLNADADFRLFDRHTEIGE